MRFSVHFRQGIKEQLGSLASEMAEWAELPRVDDTEADRIRAAIQPFAHTTDRSDLLIGGVDGSGDYPSLSYGDSFVYITVAQGTKYQSDKQTGLKELNTPGTEVLEFSWIPEDDVRRPRAIDAAFERMAGCPIEEIIEASDYKAIKNRLSRRAHSTEELRAHLIRPHAADAGNLAIQLRSVGELSAALRLIRSAPAPAYVLYDSTLSLPFVPRVRNSLFHEHLKRLCCVEARQRGIGFFSLSKSHGLPAVERIELLAKEACGTGQASAEHWFMRMPSVPHDQWELKIAETRNVPPPAAVTYLVRFHRNTPVMRLDMDSTYWEQCVKGASKEETLQNEKRIFEDLDYSSHDQRCFGYPYPIKAGHDRASLSEQERVALRKMVIDAAVSAGISRAQFRNASAATGHA